MKKYENITVSEIRVEGYPGSSFDKCISDCIILAVQENSNVKLRFNGLIYVVDHKELKQSVREIKRIDS